MLSGAPGSPRKRRRARRDAEMDDKATEVEKGQAIEIPD